MLVSPLMIEGDEGPEAGNEGVRRLLERWRIMLMALDIRSIHPLPLELELELEIELDIELDTEIKIEIEIDKAPCFTNSLICMEWYHSCQI